MIAFAIPVLSIAVFALVALGKIKPRLYFWTLLGVTLGLLWQVSLMGKHVMGTDIQQELYVSRLTYSNGWDTSIYHMYNTSIAVGLIVPFLAKVLYLDPVWIYKAILPVFLALVPPVLYLAYKEMFGEKRAFWAAVFFIAVPVMTLEIVGIGKSMVAELGLALVILVIVKDIRQVHKAWILTALTIFTILCHYTVGVIALGIIIFALIGGIISVITKVKYSLHPLVASIVLLLSTATGYFYYTNIASGVVPAAMFNSQSSSALPLPVPSLPETPSSLEKVPSPNVDSTSKDAILHGHTFTIPAPSLNISQQPTLIQTATGLDFFRASLLGKVFRIVQYLTQLLIILGLWQVVRHFRRYKTEFISCALGTMALLVACIFIPGVSTITNITRAYHMSLFVIAPLLVLGSESIVKSKWLVPGLLLVYFTFTSGVVFEATKDKIATVLNTPYSIALSNYRLGIYGEHTKEDITCAEWLLKNTNGLPIVSGRQGAYLLSSYPKGQERIADTTGQGLWSPYHLPQDKYYVFLTSWSTENGKVTEQGEPGYRILRDIPTELLNNSTVFSSGKAKVLYHGE